MNDNGNEAFYLYYNRLEIIVFQPCISMSLSCRIYFESKKRVIEMTKRILVRDVFNSECICSHNIMIITWIHCNLKTSDLATNNLFLINSANLRTHAHVPNYHYGANHHLSF